MAITRGFNKENVNHFFDLLERIVDKHKFTADTIFNVDESGFTTVQKSLPKIDARKGKHQVGSLTSGERGVNTTMVCAVSAAGVYIPPMIIFKRKKFHPNLKIGASPASIVTISDTGYINSDLFVEWLMHFQKHINCNVDNKVLLLLDGHTTHSTNLQACEFARKNGIVLLQLPGHTTDRLQPLDIAFFGPLQTYFTQAQETFLRLYKGDKIYQTQMSKLLNEVYGRAVTVGIAESVFHASRIWPVNRHVFTDDQFAPADVLQPATFVTTSSSDDEEDRSDNENKRFRRVLEEISP
ncbi:uncharacterized protein LOC143265371 [Megachile rotundata]|uniref:uncharacterized protein LOC143265371 n=1 Tax=Megachile rotundata TaxID=143995 RepID=UPI003FD0570A